MDVDVYDETGNSLTNSKGELVCKSSFPSKPIYFWNDKSFKNIKKHILIILKIFGVMEITVKKQSIMDILYTGDQMQL